MLRENYRTERKWIKDITKKEHIESFAEKDEKLKKLLNKMKKTQQDMRPTISPDNAWFYE